MPAFLPLLAQMLPSAIGLGQSLYNKFNMKNPIDTSEQQRTLDRFIANNKGDITGRTLYHTLSTPQIRQASIERQKGQRNLENLYNRGEMGVGALAQSSVNASGELGRNVADISDRAMAQQIQSNAQKQQAIQQAEMNIAQLKDSEQTGMNQMKQQTTNDIFSSLGQLGGQFQNVLSTISDEKLSEGIKTLYKTELANETPTSEIINKMILMLMTQ